MAKKKVKKAKKTKGKKKKNPPVFMLLPFKPMMIKKLKKAGIKFPDKKSKKLRNVVELFHTHIVKKKNLEDGFEMAEEYIIDDIVKIIADVFSFVKQIFGKKKKGESIPKDIQDIAGEIEEVSEKLDKAKINPEDIADENGNISDGTGRKLKDNGKGGIDIVKQKNIAGLPMPVMLGLGAAAIYFIAKK